MKRSRYLTTAKLLRWLAGMVAVAVSAALATPGTASATEYFQNNTTVAGFASSRVSGEPLAEVEASWHVPAVLDCSLGDYALTAVWVGLSGASDPEHFSDSWLPQVGTDSRCTGSAFNNTHYAAVWELYNSTMDTGEQTFGMTISPGDLVHAWVLKYGQSSDGSQFFMLSLTRTDAHGNTETDQQPVATSRNVDLSKAATYGWSVVETKSEKGLAKFDAFDITNFLVSPAPFPPGLNTYVFKLVNSNDQPLAETTQTSGTSWRVTWKARD